MKSTRFSWILYFIVATIAITIAVQVYWNYRNYQVNKQQFINQVQISLDNAVDAYYADIAKKNRVMFVSMNTSNGKSFPSFKDLQRMHPDTIVEFFEKDSLADADTIIINGRQNASEFSYKNIDSLLRSAGIDLKKIEQISKTQKRNDSIQLFNQVSSLYVTISEDSLDFLKLNTFLETEFDRKQISFPYQLKQYHLNNLVADMKVDLLPPNVLKTTAKSAYLKPGDSLELQYANITKAVLQKSSVGILLSTLLTLAIISSLVYLVYIINKQKQLAEIKNDLISNITHEFKTPITTISTALEAMQHFDGLNDPEKTKKYLSISNNQLKKLHIMVEKLLETATLDSEKLLLQKEEVDLVDFIEKIVEKHQYSDPKKTILFRSNVTELPLELDLFHFENAVTNLIDNAVKYGGNHIEINISKVLQHAEITVVDNGGTIDKSQREKIFDKFYRIPKGNTHDVKGFGIGLYYTKKIIEKHNGTIQLIPDAKHTIFKITLHA